MSEIETLHVPFKHWLERDQKGIAYTYHRPDRPTGGTLGDADFILYAAPSHFLMIEFKDKETKISPSQKKRHAELLALGITVHVLRSLGSAVELAQAWFATLGEFQESPAASKTSDEITVGGSVWRRKAPGERYEFARLAPR